MPGYTAKHAQLRFCYCLNNFPPKVAQPYPTAPQLNCPKQIRLHSHTNSPTHDETNALVALNGSETWGKQTMAILREVPSTIWVLVGSSFPVHRWSLEGHQIRVESLLQVSLHPKCIPKNLGTKSNTLHHLLRIKDESQMDINLNLS